MSLIIFEGGEGVGKTTQLEKLHNLLIRQNLPVLKTREPGGTPFAEKIRSLFKEKTDTPPNALTELYLVTAARNEHIRNVLANPLNEKKIILCDRFLDSTYVYQSIVGGIAKSIVDELSKPVLNNIMPDLTFVFYCDEEIAKKRMQKESNRTLDRYDSSETMLHTNILNGYKTLFDEKYAYPNGKIPLRIMINAEKSVEEIFNTIITNVNNHIISLN